MSWIEHLRPGIRELAPVRVRLDESGGQLVRLDCNEAPFPLDADELAELHAALAGLSFQRYPEPSGASLRRALGERWLVDPAQILLGNGSVEVLALLATALGGGRHGRRARMLYPDPSFPYYEVLARTHGLQPIATALERDFSLDERRFAQALTEHMPALTIVASPNNPTGNPFPREALLRLARRTDAAFVVDEAYIDFVDEGAAGATLIPFVRDVPGLFVTRTLSKLGFAGLRVGALIGAPDAVAELDKVRLPWNLSATSLAFAEVLLSRPERIEARVRALRALREGFRAALESVLGLHVFPSQTNFVLVSVAPLSAQTVFERLLARGIAVKNVARPGVLDGCLRITVGTTADNERCASVLREELARMRAA